MEKQFQIKSFLRKNRLVLAPLAGYTDLPFRLLCRRYGAGLCYSEMLSCHGLSYRKKNTLQMTRSVPEDRPIAFQIFGADPDRMGRAAALISEMDVDVIDINMGCPVKKVVKKGAGAALMKQPELARKIISEVCRHSGLPVSVKIRTGWNSDSLNGPEFARMAEDCGISAVAVHGRTWSQGFGGPVDWQTISRVKENVSIPVIGNGDVGTYQEAIQKIVETGCDGIMIGRAALGNPWVFTSAGTPDSLEARTAGLKIHLELVRDFSSPEKILPRIKNQAGRYFKGITGGSAIRRQIYQASSFEMILDLLESLQHSPSRP